MPPENFPFCAKTVADQVCDVPSQVATSLKNPKPKIENRPTVWVSEIDPSPVVAGVHV